MQTFKGSTVAPPTTFFTPGKEKKALNFQQKSYLLTYQSMLFLVLGCIWTTKMIFPYQYPQPGQNGRNVIL